MFLYSVFFKNFLRNLCLVDTHTKQQPATGYIISRGVSLKKKKDSIILQCDYSNRGTWKRIVQ